MNIWKRLRNYFDLQSRRRTTEASDSPPPPAGMVFHPAIATPWKTKSGNCWHESRGCGGANMPLWGEAVPGNLVKEQFTNKLYSPCKNCCKTKD